MSSGACIVSRCARLLKEAKVTSLPSNLNWLKDVLAICQASSKALGADKPTTRCSRAMIGPPDVNTAMRACGAASASRRSRPPWTRVRKPSQLSNVSFFVPAGDPLLDDLAEQSLEVARLSSGLLQGLLHVLMDWKQVRKMGSDHGIDIDLVEGRIGFDGGNLHAGESKLFQRRAGGVLLAPERAADTAVEADSLASKMGAKHFGLTFAQGREYIVILSAERGLAMSDQINAAHVHILVVIVIFPRLGGAVEGCQCLLLRRPWNSASSCCAGRGIALSVCLSASTTPEAGRFVCVLKRGWLWSFFSIMPVFWPRP